MRQTDEKAVKEKGIRIGSEGRDSVSLKNLTNDEVEKIEGMTNGHYWLTITDGRLEVVQRRDDLPSPVEDAEMLPFWRRATSQVHQLELFGVKLEKYSMTSIIIQHLCGYCYSPENYTLQAQKLESYGFVCMRSRRGNDARFHEIWFLPSQYHAKNDLKESFAHIEDDKKKIKRMVEFLCCNVLFGTLDLSQQRAAMPIPD